VAEYQLIIDFEEANGSIRREVFYSALWIYISLLKCV
jgi:hypothetical protein